MNELIIAYFMLVVMLILICFSCPIAFALGACGSIGLLWISGFEQASMQIMLVVWSVCTDSVILCIPLFILMGYLVFNVGIAADLYDGMYKWIGRLPGGLAMATVFSCALFAAVTGSSAASAATMGPIALPELKRYKYADRFAVGVLASAGTLAIMIPPSTVFMLYGILTDTSIGDLFIAGIIPGILISIAWVILIFFHSKIYPITTEVAQRFSWVERFVALKLVFPIIILFLFIMGGIYLGVFTPTEAAGMGVLGATLIGISMGRLKWSNFINALFQTGEITAMIFTIIIGGLVLNRFLVISGVVPSFVNFITLSLKLTPLQFIGLLVVLYSILGCFMEGLCIIILTMPFIFPIIRSMGFDPIWFGVFVCVMIEIGLLTPPLGINVLVIHKITPELPLSEAFKGIIPFLIALYIFVGFIILFPEIPLWLVHRMKL